MLELPKPKRTRSRLPKSRRQSPCAGAALPVMLGLRRRSPQSGGDRDADGCPTGTRFVPWNSPLRPVLDETALCDRSGGSRSAGRPRGHREPAP